MFCGMYLVKYMRVMSAMPTVAMTIRISMCLRGQDSAKDGEQSVHLLALLLWSPCADCSASYIPVHEAHPYTEHQELFQLHTDLRCGQRKHQWLLLSAVRQPLNVMGALQGGHPAGLDGVGGGGGGAAHALALQRHFAAALAPAAGGGGRHHACIQPGDCAGLSEQIWRLRKSMGG